MKLYPMKWMLIKMFLLNIRWFEYQLQNAALLPRDQFNQQEISSNNARTRTEKFMLWKAVFFLSLEM